VLDGRYADIVVATKGSCNLRRLARERFDCDVCVAGVAVDAVHGTRHGAPQGVRNPQAGKYADDLPQTANVYQVLIHEGFSDPAAQTQAQVAGEPRLVDVAGRGRWVTQP